MVEYKQSKHLYVKHGGVFLYIKILVSEQGNAACEKLSNCYNLLIMRNDKKDYRNSQHFAFAF